MGGTLQSPRRLFRRPVALLRAAALWHTVLDTGVAPT